jgi:integrase
MTATTPSTVLVPIQPVFTDAERLALAGFLAGYRGLTREAYALDLRQFTTWCRTRSVPLFTVRRADIEGFARDLEARGRARATVTRRLCTIAGFYKYAVEEELLDHSPAAHVRRPRVDYESHAVALDRNELGALLVAAGLGPPSEHALISLLALNGLRVSEATGADIEHLGLERGHRILTITRKGGKVVTIPLAPRTARAIDLAVGERCGGPIFLSSDGRRLDRHATYIVAAYLRRRRPVTRAGKLRLAGPAAGQAETASSRRLLVVTQRQARSAVMAAEPADQHRRACRAEPGVLCQIATGGNGCPIGHPRGSLRRAECVSALARMSS